MPLQVKINRSKQISAAGDLLYIKDATGQHGAISYVKNPDTDLFDQVINETGYGAENGLRESVAIFVLGFIHQTNGEAIALEFEAYDPLTATEFVALTLQDAVVDIAVIVVPAFAELPLDLPDGAFYYDTNLLALYRNDPAELVEVEPQELRDTAYQHDQTQFFCVAQNALKKISLMRELVQNFRNPSGCTDARFVQDKYVKQATCLKASIYEYLVGNAVNAQGDIEYLNSQLDVN